ncbi:MAG: response regulator transcription factor [Acidimicrobiales bacterium]|jgi:DNA-binding response OmpR family regulator
MAGTGDTLVVIEDDHNISDLVAMYLRRDGFRVLQADDGESGLALIDREHPTLVILDLGLPGALDGYDVCRRLRAAATPGPGHGAGTPVLILSARDDELDRVLGLELGADDYVTKPFSARELVARVHAILRRSQAGGAAQAPRVVQIGDVAVDLDRREVRVAGQPVAFTAREFDLLAYLVTNLGLVLSRRQLLDGVWGDEWYGDERTVDVHVRQLRKKLGPDLPLVTIWGVGYRMG